MRHVLKHALVPQIRLPQATDETVGQAALAPVQLAARIAVPSLHEAARHCVSKGANTSVGQFLLEPSHNSATSQTPAMGRHGVFAETTASAGQFLFVPSQFSAKSQAPASPRHTVLALATESSGQAAPVPVQNSARSQSPFLARHSFVAGSNALIGQLVLVPLHVSAGSQTSVLARQTAPLASVVQVPRLDAELHAWQSLLSPPPQALLQHTPSMQLPLLQPALTAQAVPLGLGEGAKLAIAVPFVLNVLMVQVGEVPEHKVPVHPANVSPETATAFNTTVVP